jgi:hypothetical protein
MLALTRRSGRNGFEELENQMLDLKILNSGMDIVIDQLRKEREG